jgi:apolipoprotein N-acyltransferase
VVVTSQASGVAGTGRSPVGGGSLPIGLALALLTIGFVAMSFPPVGAWPLIWVAFVPMVVAQHRFMPPRWSSLAVGIGLGGMFAFHYSRGLAEGHVSRLVQAWPVLAALLIAALAWRSRAFQERTGYRWFVISPPLAWVALDFLRASGTEVLGATTGYPAYALYAHPTLLQPISVLGIDALELLLLMVNWAVAGLVIAVMDRRRTQGPRLPLRSAVRNGAAVAALLVCWVVAGVRRMGSAPPTVRVAAVQTGVRRGADWEETYRRDVAQTREAAARGAKLVVWDEAGLRIDPTKRLGDLRALARETGVHLAVGYLYTDARGRRHNEVLLMTPAGDVLGVYGKDHPGTFAGDYSDTRGTYPVFETGLGPIATIICYDLDFTDTARKVAGGGARLVATPSADLPAIADTHYTHLVFRAIENRVTMVKADNEFDSAIIDPWGRILARAVSPDGGLQTTLVADVPLGSPDTPWVRFGDWPGWLAVAGTALFAVLSLRRGRADHPLGDA